MAEIALVKVLSTFFGIDSILICHDNEINDDDVYRWTSAVNVIDVGLHMFNGESKLGSRSFHEDMTLVYLDGEKCFHKIFHLVGLLSNSVWLAPDTVRVPSAKHLRLDSNWISFSSNSDTKTTELVEHFGALHKKAFSQHFGTFSPVLGLNIPEVEIWRRRSNLDGANLINTVNAYPYVINFVDDHYVLDGLLPELMTSLQLLMNFTVTNVRPPDEDWGVEKEHKNGTKYWSGMVGELVAKRADVSIAGLTIKAERGRVIDFTVAVLPEILTVIIGKRSLSTSNINTMAFIKCLSPTTWLVFMAFAALHGICYSIVMVAKNGRNYKFGFWHLYGFIAVGKVFLKLPVAFGKWLSERMLYFTIFVLCLFVFEGYIGNLTAEMTVGKPKVQLKSFQDIIDNEMTISVTKGTVSDFYFAQAEEGTAQYIVNKNHVNRYILDVSEIRKTVDEIDSDPKSAYFETIIPFLEYDKVKPLLNFNGRISSAIGIALQKNSEFKAAFDYHIIKMRQSGLLHEMYDNYILQDKPEDMSGGIFTEDILILGFDQLFLPVIIIGLGIILALTILAYEKAFSAKCIGFPMEMTPLKENLANT